MMKSDLQELVIEAKPGKEIESRRLKKPITERSKYLHQENILLHFVAFAINIRSSTGVLNAS